MGRSLHRLPGLFLPEGILCITLLVNEPGKAEFSLA